MATATNNELLQLSGTVDLTAAAADSTKPVKVSIVGYTGNTMSVSGWKNPVAVELSGVDLPASIPLLSDHRAELDGVLGTATPRVSGSTLTAEGVLSHSSMAAQRIIGLSRDGVSFQSSMGLEVQKSKDFRPGETAVVNGHTITAGGRGLTVVLTAKLRELSILSLGADGNTSVAISAQRNRTMTAELNTDTTDLQADRLRAASVPTWLADAPDLVAKAISEGWNKERCELENLRAFRCRTELEQLRAARPIGPAVHSSRGDVSDSDTLTASLCLNAGMAESFVGEHFSEPVMNAAVSREGRTVTFQTVLRSVARAVGNPLREGKLTAADVKQAFEADLQLRAGGFSTLSIPGVLGSAATKSLLSGYKAVNAIAPLLCAKRDLQDFKAWTHYRLTESGLLEQVGKGGELKHTTVREASFTNQLSTYGRMIAFTREDLINDDLGALSDVPRMLGRMAALKVEDAFFTMLLSNPSTFFGTGNNNYIEGSGTTLQISQLDALTRKFRDQTDPDGKPVLLVPKFLLVPTALDATARQLIASTELMGSTTADTLKPSGNPFANTLTVLSSPYLGNTSYTGASSTAWYLIAEPTDVAAFGIGFLNGVQAPTIESAEADFNTLGVQMRCYFDFGVGMEDHRAAAKSKSAA